MTTQLYAQDNGYYDCKGMSKCGITKIRSKIRKTEGEVFDDNIIEYKNQKHVVGEGKDDIKTNKTLGLTHKICTLKNLADNTKYKNEFNLMLSLPLNHYKNKKFRNNFKQYMSSPNTNYIKQNGIKKEIIIKNSTVIPQGVAALYADNPRQYKDKMVAVLDIGGMTVDGCITESLKTIPETIFTINLGTMILENKIKTALNQKFLTNIQDYEIPYLMKNGIEGYEIESMLVIKEVYDEYFDAIIREMLTKNWSIETLDIVGVGGGVLKLANILSEHIPRLKPSKSPVYDNVKGLYNIGKVMYGEN